MPQRLRATAEQEPGGQVWLERLPATLDELSRRWQLTLGATFEAEASCSWVAPARAAGTSCVLKLALPHYEGAQEIAGLRFWSGEPTVRLLDACPELHALLLERCEPGTPLRALPEPEQDATQHLLNCRPRLSAAPWTTLERLAEGCRPRPGWPGAVRAALAAVARRRPLGDGCTRRQRRCCPAALSCESSADRCRSA